MKYLLDTHVFLWYILADSRLSNKAFEIIQSRENDIKVSIVSVWEMIVKSTLGKLPLPRPYHDFILQQVNNHSLSFLEISNNEFRHLEELERIHKDPFDRLLICQSIEYNLSFITNDDTIKKYNIQIVY